MEEKKKLTEYAKMKAAHRKFCQTGTDTAKQTALKAEERYISDATKKGKKSSEIKAIVSTSRSCKTKKK